MPAATPDQPSNVVYIGTFAHCSSSTEVEVLERKAIGVDERGVIRFIREGGEQLGEQIKTDYGWDTWKTIKASDDTFGFFFPGFIGRFDPKTRSATIQRDAHPRPQIPTSPPRSCPTREASARRRCSPGCRSTRSRSRRRWRTWLKRAPSTRAASSARWRTAPRPPPTTPPSTRGLPTYWPTSATRPGSAPSSAAATRTRTSTRTTTATRRPTARWRIPAPRLSISRRWIRRTSW